MAKKNTNLSNFESDLKKLQDILDDKYKEGVELSKKCQKALEDAKQIIKVLDHEK